MWELRFLSKQAYDGDMVSNELRISMTKITQIPRKKK